MDNQTFKTYFVTCQLSCVDRKMLFLMDVKLLLGQCRSPSVIKRAERTARLIVLNLETFEIVNYRGLKR